MEAKMRKLTPQEIEDDHKGLIEHLNQLADCESRKKDFQTVIKEEIDYHKKMVTKIRREINAGEIEMDPQTKLPLAG
jgi:hypothetical protein